MKKILAIMLCIVLAISVFAGCGNKEDEQTSEETAAATEAAQDETSEATEAVEESAEATAEPTEEPEPTIIVEEDLYPVDCSISDYTTDIDVDGWYASGCERQSIEDNYMTVVSGGAGTFTSLRMKTTNDYERDNEGSETYPFYAIMYKFGEGSTAYAQQPYWLFCTEETDFTSGYMTCDYAGHELIDDGEWHLFIIDFANDIPEMISEHGDDDGVDCIKFYGAAEAGGETYIVFNGLFQSAEDAQTLFDYFMTNYLNETVEETAEAETEA